MTTAKEDRELDELNDFIGREIYGFSPAQYYYAWSVDGVFRPPTTDKAHALDLLAKCAEKCKCVRIWSGENVWSVSSDQQRHMQGSPTLPLAICRFARAIFSKKAEGGE